MGGETLHILVRASKLSNKKSKNKKNKKTPCTSLYGRGHERGEGYKEKEE
jgi:hypothetical protein